MNDQIPCIITMVNTWGGSGNAYADSLKHKAQAHAQKQETERTLAPLLKVMHETGLTDPDAGFKLALAAHMSVDWHPRAPVAATVKDRLTRARAMLDERINLLVLPAAVIVYGDAVMGLLGPATAGRIWQINDGGSFELF